MNKVLSLIKVIVAMAVASFMSSCTITENNISTTNYEKTIRDVNASIENLGYKLSGTSSDNKNNLYVAGVSYTIDAGYGSAMGNDHYWYDTYQFIDSENNTTSYQVKYKKSKDDRNNYFVTNISVTSCNCSKSDDFNKICGYDGITKKIINIEEDQTSTFDDRAGSLLLGTSVFLGVLAVMLIMIL